MASGNFPRFLADFGIRKSFTDSFFYTVLFFRAEQTPVDPALDGIQKFQPVLERRFRNCLPLIIAPFTAEESPIASDVLDINLEMHSRIGDASPTDLSFWHDLSLRQIDTGDSHRRDSFFAAQKPEMLIRSRLDAHLANLHLQRGRDIQFHLFHMRK